MSCMIGMLLISLHGTAHDSTIPKGANQVGDYKIFQILLHIHCDSSASICPAGFRLHHGCRICGGICVTQCPLQKVSVSRRGQHWGRRRPTNHGNKWSIGSGQYWYSEGGVSLTCLCIVSIKTSVRAYHPYIYTRLRQFCHGSKSPETVALLVKDMEVVSFY